MRLPNRARRLAVTLTVAGIAVAGGCATPSGPAGPLATITPVDQSERALSPVIANSELVVGDNRFLFGLLDAQNRLVDDAEVALTLFYLGDDPDAPEERSQVSARLLEVGLEDLDETLNEPVPSLYVAMATFDRPGRWGVELRAERLGEQLDLRLAFEVVEESVAPNVGDAAPASQSRTYFEGTELSQITSDPHPDPDLYQITIAEAIASGRPTVISFSTPAFCTSRTCGPALEVVKAAKDRFGGEAHFIHVEIYEDFSTLTVDPTVLDWRLPSEPWTFVVDGKGTISARFEGLVGLSELEAAIQEVLA